MRRSEADAVAGRGTVAGDGPRVVPGDVVRAAAVVSLAVGPVTHGGVAAALLFLVLGGTVVPRALGLPTVLDVTFGASLLLAAWAALLGWYDAVSWLDLAVHAVCTGLVAAVGVELLHRLRVITATPAPGWGRAGHVAVTAGVGALGAVLWELGEWAGHTFLDDDISVGYADTVGDLAAGVLGAAAAGVVLAARTREPARD